MEHRESFSLNSFLLRLSAISILHWRRKETIDTNVWHRPLYELANYQILGRILYYVPHLSPIHPGRVLTTFAFISAVIESLNANGAVNAFNSSLPEKRQNLGKSLLKAALLMQLIVVVLFISLAGTFHRRIRRAGVVRPGIYTVLWSLYASSALITARTIYRTAEYFGVAAIKIGQGVDDADLGVEIRYEWFFYVFEAVLMLCNAWLGNIKHPRKYLPKSTKMYLARDGVTEIEGPGYKDTRKFIVTLIDPFDLASLFKRSGQHGAFWDEDAQGHKSGEGTTTVVDSAMEKRNKNTTAENV